MKIKQLQVDLFGRWQDLRLDHLSQQVTVFYGPNEAGKTTLLQFVRAILYGFQDSRRQSLLDSFGNRSGGVIDVSHHDRSYSIQRHVTATDAVGEPLVTDGHTPRKGQAAVSELLGGVDESTFSRVFAVGLREIQELGTLNDGEAAHLLYDLTLGLDRVSLSEIVSHLEGERKGLLAAEDEPCAVNELLLQRERLQRELHQLGELLPRYLELRTARDSLNGEITRLENQRTSLQNQSRLLELARSLRERWLRREDLARQVAALPPLKRMPEDIQQRLADLNEKISGYRKQLEGTSHRRKQLQQEIQALGINELLIQQAPRVVGLTEQQGLLETLGNQAQQLKKEVAELETQVASSAKTLETHVGKPNWPRLTTAAEATLRAQAKSLLQMRRQYHQAQAHLSAKKQIGDKLTEDLPNPIEHLTGDKLTKALERAGELVTNLRRRLQIEERQDQQTRRLRELEEHCQLALQNQILDPGTLSMIGFFFVGGAALVLVFLLKLAFHWQVPIDLPWALVGGVSMLGSWAVKYRTETTAAEDLDVSQRQLSKLRSQLKEMHAERDELDASLPRGGGPFAVRLKQAEDELAELEERVPIESKRGEVQHQSRVAQQKHDSFAKEYQRLSARWRQTLVEMGLPEKLTPRQMRDFLQHGQQHFELRQRLEARRAEFQDRTKQHAALAERIHQLAVEVGTPVTGPANEPITLLKGLVTGIREQETKQQRRSALQAELSRLRRKRREIASLCAKVERKRRRLLALAGASDEDEVQQILQHTAQQQRLRTEHEGLVAELDHLLTGHPQGGEIRDLLQTQAQLESLAAEVLASLTTLKQRSDQLHEQRGEMNQKLKALIDDRRLADKQIELSIVEQKLDAALKKWQVLAHASLIVEDVRKKYERDRQPDTLREATHYLSRFTDGRYARVWTPLGQQVLKVDDAQGRSFEIEALSRGTREQLFLALRMALVSAFAQRGVRLPLVLDDVLVNFDVDRTATAAGVIGEFAQAGHQILLFTCHRHVAEMFRERKADVRNLPGVIDAQPLPPPPPSEPVVRAPEPPPIERVMVRTVRTPAAVRSRTWHPEPAPAPQRISVRTQHYVEAPHALAGLKGPAYASARGSRREQLVLTSTAPPLADSRDFFAE